MITELKALIVVCAIGCVIFWLAKPIALQFSAQPDFARRRAVWFTLTAAGLLCPNFWLYALFAGPLLWWAGRKDANPIALYLLTLHVIPPILVAIPVLGNNGLFDLDNYRLLAFCVLAPTAWRLRKTRKVGRDNSATLDIVLLAYGVLVFALYTVPDLPHHAYIADSPTNALRRAFLFLLDTYLLYWVVKRVCTTSRAITEAIAAFCLASVIMAGVAIFESVRHWLLYIDIAVRWGSSPTAGFYLTHGSQVRAQASSGHALSLGYLLAVAFALWMYLKTQITSKAYRIAVPVILWMGLFASFSRGPWLGAALSFFVFSAITPGALSRTVKAVVIAAVLTFCIALTPVGHKVIDAMPFFKSTQDADLIYRQRLAARGWELVREHPLFGDHFPWPEMEDLRQGEGIIDMVNSYLGVAMSYGLTGLALFVGFILLVTIKAYARVRALARSQPAMALLGASLVAAFVANLLMIANSSFIQGSSIMFYVLAALAVAYARIGTVSAPRRATQLRQHDMSRRIR